MILSPYRFATGGGGGSDPYWTSVTTLLHFDGVDGATSVTDETGRTWTGAGGAKLTTAQSVFGPSSALFDGDGDYYESNNSSGLLIEQASPYTIECFFRKTGAGSTGNGTGIYGQCIDTGAGEQGMMVTTAGALRMERESNANGGTVQTVTTATGLVSNDVWYHLAESYDGTTIRGFLGGALVLSVASSRGWNTHSEKFKIGSVTVPSYSSYRREMNGTIDEFRITRGIARYTSAFTPPTAAFPNS